MITYIDRLMTLQDFAKESPYKYSWLLEATKRKDDPLPTFQRAKTKTVLFSAVTEWLERNYGNDGKLRGQEYLEPKGLK